MIAFFVLIFSVFNSGFDSIKREMKWPSLEGVIGEKRKLYHFVCINVSHFKFFFQVTLGQRKAISKIDAE